MKISIIIPCTSKHILYLENLIKIYEKQTVIPDEIVIIISGIEMSFNTQSELFSKKIEVIIKVFPEKRFAGINRKTGAFMATGDILIFQDADDLPHNQRVEVIKNIFEKEKCFHLLHGWEYDNNINLDIDNIKTYLSKDVFIVKRKKLLRSFMYTCSYKNINRIHNGAFSIDKRIINKIEWSDKRKGQDLETNYNIINAFPKSSFVIASNKLYKYRNNLSSWN